MRLTLLLCLIATLITPPLEAANRRYSSDDVYVSGHTRRDGTYVEPYYRSAPNANRWDNYGYEPSQPTYNSRGSNTPNPGRLNDNNPYNDYPGSGGNLYGR